MRLTAKSVTAWAQALLLTFLCSTPSSGSDEVRPGVLRTPDSRFQDLPDFDFEPHYLEIKDFRVHYIDEGPSDGLPVLLMHGEPSWCYLYRHMIPIVASAGHRVIAPDLVGFGRSDKPIRRKDYTYQMHVDVITELITTLDLNNITMFCQDWGGLVGLRVAAANENRFARIIASNTLLPAGDGQDGIILGTDFTEQDPNAQLETSPDLPDAFTAWLKYSQTIPELPVGEIIQRNTIRELSTQEVAAYDAPFPSERYKAGARVMPTLVASQQATNRRAWKVFEQWEKPFLTAYSDSDPITGHLWRDFRKRVPGIQGHPHRTIKNAGHFLQEDAAIELGTLIVESIAEKSEMR